MARKKLDFETWRFLGTHQKSQCISRRKMKILIYGHEFCVQFVPAFFITPD